MKRRLNTTADGELACAYSTPWLDHWQPPIGTGKGCKACDMNTAGCDHKFVDSNTCLKCGWMPPPGQDRKSIMPNWPIGEMYRERAAPKKLKASERLEQLHLSTSNTVAMLDRRAEAIKQTLGEENPLRLDLLKTKELLLQIVNEL